MSKVIPKKAKTEKNIKKCDECGKITDELHGAGYSKLCFECSEKLDTLIDEIEEY